MSRIINTTEIKELTNKHIKDLGGNFWEQSAKKILFNYLLCEFLKEKDLEQSIKDLKEKTYSEFLEAVSFLIIEEDKELERLTYSGFSEELLKELEKRTGMNLYSNFINKLI